MPTKDELKNTLKELEKALDEKKGKPSKQLEDNIKRFLKDCNTYSDEDWKTKVMIDSEKTVVEELNNYDKLEKEPDLKQELGLHMRWVVPIPPDPVVVAYVIARDLAQEAREKNGD